MKKILSLSLIILLLPIISFSESKLYTDIDFGEKYFTSTSYLSDKGVINGYEDGSFKPKNDINRVEALKMIFLALEKDINKDEQIEEKYFPDTEGNSWYNPYIKYGIDKEIINGYPDGTFKPSNNINLVETLKIIGASQELDYPDTQNFNHDIEDIDLNEWYGKYIAYALEKNIVVPFRNKLYPSYNVSRGEMADLLYKFDIVQKSNGKPFKHKESGQASFYADQFHGLNTANGEIFDMHSYTAAHMTLPFGTILEINPQGNKNKIIYAKVNDRGAFNKYGRIIDLSKQAFTSIAPISNGITNVDITEYDLTTDFHKKIYNFKEELPDLFEEDTEFPSVFLKNEYLSKNFRSKIDIEIELTSPNQELILEDLIEAGTEKTLNFRFTQTGIYKLFINDVEFKLYVLDQPSRIKNYKPSYNKNNFNFSSTGTGGIMNFSWNSINPDSIYMITFISEYDDVFHYIVNNSNTFEYKIPNDTPEADELPIKEYILSENKNFTGFSIDQYKEWEPRSVIKNTQPE